MSQLVSYYEDKPVELKGQVEIHQMPIEHAVGSRSVEGAIRTGVVYVEVRSEPGPFLVPFADYDDWSLRDRYNEAIRIMNTLGAATITCETYREAKSSRQMVARIVGRVGNARQRRVENSGFDFSHSGAGSAPRDPRPLRWPNEPGFAAAVSSVLENGATEVSININSSRTHSLEGKLGVTLKGIGFELGGGAQQSGASRLQIRASFPQQRRLWR
jgi:hypothetical protein